MAAKIKGTKLNEYAVTGFILENYPGADELILPDDKRENSASYAELKENAVVGNYTFDELAEAARNSGDPLFGWIVTEAKEGGWRTDGKTDDDGLYYDADEIVRVLKRGSDDILAIVRTFENL